MAFKSIRVSQGCFGDLAGSSLFEIHQVKSISIPYLLWNRPDWKLLVLDTYDTIAWRLHSPHYARWSAEEGQVICGIGQLVCKSIYASGGSLLLINCGKYVKWFIVLWHALFWIKTNLFRIWLTRNYWHWEGTSGINSFWIGASCKFWFIRFEKMFYKNTGNGENN